MIDKETLIGLLIEGLAHWDENVESFKGLEGKESQFTWFIDNCYSINCSLCCYKDEYDIEHCSDFCPLDDGDDDSDGEYTPCCVEWQDLADKCTIGTATIEDVEAMRNRIQRELDKITADVD